ncbi:BnaC05g43770D [Brassica napus]|uniref:BnaC05g43770D protein n=1 Tax=Brassica napus TaxID=3708 RepID=A0A078GN31_BRANA|nr:BnaC05g43770D [Brassica napus]
MERLIKGDSVSTTRKRKTTTTSIREKKKKKLTSSSSLAYDLLVMIVARVPRSYYRTLSLVSKSFRSMVVSPELYKWYTLSKKSSGGGGYVLARVLMLDDDSPRMMGLCYSDLVASPPRMPVELTELSARFLDRKIYVLGRRFHQDDGSWKSSFEVFNTNTQTWDLPSCGGFDSARINYLIDGKLHVVTLFDGLFAFDSKQCRWDLVEQYPSTGIMCSGSFCEVDNVLYSVSEDGALTWYDSDKTSWRDLNGLVALPKLPSPLDGYGSYVKLTGYGGGKMMVFWNCNFGIHRPFQRDTIYCAEIALERRNGDCWGKLEWFDTMLLVPVETQFR